MKVRDSTPSHPRLTHDAVDSLVRVSDNSRGANQRNSACHRIRPTTVNDDANDRTHRTSTETWIGLTTQGPEAFDEKNTPRLKGPFDNSAQSLPCGIWKQE